MSFDLFCKSRKIAHKAERFKKMALQEMAQFDVQRSTLFVAALIGTGDDAQRAEIHFMLVDGERIALEAAFIGTSNDACLLCFLGPWMHLRPRSDVC